MAFGVLAYVALVWVLRGELGMAWDEPPDIERIDAVRGWLARLPSDGAKSFSRSALERGWWFTGQAPHEHPPVYALLGLVTGEALGWLVGPLRAYRLANVLLVSIAAGVLFRLVQSRWGLGAASAALGGLLFNPRLFADAQLVTLDAVVGSFWFCAAAAFLRGCETGRRPWLFGVLLGLTVMSKATGALVAPTLLLWTLIYRPRGACRQLAWSLAITPAVMLAVNPRWWPNPVTGVIEWAGALLHYQQKIPVYYLGRVYDSKTTFLPWHNSAVLTLTMVPVGLLALAALGFVATAWPQMRHRSSGPSQPAAPGDGNSEFLADRAVAGWALIPFLTLLVLRMFRFMPAHDGLRQLAPAFFFFPVLVGYGARVLMARGKWSRVAQGAVLACVLSAGWETLHVHPYELSYYNVLIGGPKGAKAAGMETTYYWDSATSPVLDWMNGHLAEGTTVLIFPPPDVRTFAWLQRQGRLRRDLTFLNLDPPRFQERLALLEGDRPCVLLFQMRQGLYEPRSAGDSPFFVRLAGAPALFEWAPRRVGVRLLAIFDAERLRASREGKSSR